MADNEETAKVKQKAREWIDRLNSGAGLEGAWRLQRIEKRTRRPHESGEETPKDPPFRIRRFAKGIPVNYVDEAIRYLLTPKSEGGLFPYSGIVFNGTRMDGEYRPTRTWWERDEQAVVDRGQMRENTYTIFQDLIRADDSGDEEEFSAGGSCSESVSMRYEYDTFSIEDVAVPPGSQGVTVSIQAISRNEDGTFDYAVVTRKAKTAIGTRQVVKCDEYQVVEQQTFQNLYGVEGDYRYDDDTPITDFPHPCGSREDGLLVEVQSRKNDDCTYDATVTWTTAREKVQLTETRKAIRGITETERVVATDPLPEDNLDLGEQVRNELRPDGLYDVTHVTVTKQDVGDVGSSCDRTVFQHEHSDMRNEANRPEEEALQAGGGKTYRVQSRATEEGTWDVTRSETTELASMNAQVRKRKSLRGVTETVVHRNVEDNSAVVTNIGDEVQVERTPGGLYNRTETTVTKQDVGDVGSQCQKTIFEHEHAGLRNEANRPEEEALAAGGGVIHEVSSRATEEGTWDVTRKTTVEQNVKSARVVRQKTLRGVTETVVERNSADGSVPVLKLGDRVEVEKTPGGLYNRTVSSVAAESAGSIGSGCQKTVFQHEHSGVTNVSSNPGGHVSDAGNGVYYERNSRATDEGTWDVTERTVTELSVPGAQRSRQKTLRGITETTVDRNVDNDDVSVVDIGDRVQIEKTPGGKWNRTVTRVSKESVGDVGSSCENTIFEHRHVDSENVATRPEKEALPAGGGKIYQVQARATEEGSWDVSRTETTELAVRGAQRIKRKTLRGVTETIVHRNVADSSVSVSEIGDEVRVEQTPGGRWNRTETHAVPEPVGQIAKACSRTFMTHTNSTVKNVADGSQPDPYHREEKVNFEKSLEVRRTEEGSWDVTERDTEHKEVVVYGHELEDLAKIGTVDRTIHLHTLRNVKSEPDIHDPEDGWAHTGLSTQLNEHGSMDATWQEHEAKELKKWELEVTHHNYYYQKTVWFRNASEDEYKDIVDKEVIAFNNKVRKWVDDDRPPANISITPSVNDTEFVNRYNGNITVRATWDLSQAGQEGEADKLLMEAYYNYRERDMTPDRVVRTVTKYRKVTQGRGKKLFNTIWNEMSLDTELKQTASKSFSFNVNTSVWTITYDRTYW